MSRVPLAACHFKEASGPSLPPLAGEVRRGRALSEMQAAFTDLLRRLPFPSQAFPASDEVKVDLLCGRGFSPAPDAAPASLSRLKSLPQTA